MGTLTVSGTRLLMDGRPYAYQGLSFFNALYNPELNRSDEVRRAWLGRFRSWGITALRVWGDWRVQNGWVDEGPDCSLWDYPGVTRYASGEIRNRLYEPEGGLLPGPLERLQRLLAAADAEGMVIEIALFTHYLVYPTSTRDGYLQRITGALSPWRNAIFEVWNEHDDDTLRHLETIKRIDPERLVTNAPGGAGRLGDEAENRMLDLLAPHTFRHGDGHFWEVAPRQVTELLARFGKPVLDDEPARTGTPKHGGNPGSEVWQHLAHIDAVRHAGGYGNYHHDMFQGGYGAPTTPRHGIPDPAFSPFHRQVFEHLRELALAG